MARIETDPNYNAPTFSRATASTDLFKKEDVQALAAAMSTHDHSTGKGVVLAAGSIPNGTITSAMIADATIDTADLKDGAVTSAKILDGTIATGDLAAGAVTNAKLAADTARANLLTNPSFEIWQRGNGAFTTNGAFTADRWSLSIQGSSTLSVSRDTSNTDGGGGACMAATYTHNTASSIQQLSGESAPQLRSKAVTLSVRVRTSTANAVRIGLYDGISAVVYGSFHSGGGAYETLTVTATLASNATSMTVLLSLNASCTAYFDNAMLVVGSVAADYAPLHPADDLARCFRYYQALGPNSGSSLNVSGIATAGGQSMRTTLTFVQKAVTPTITKVGTWALGNGGGQPTIPTLDVDSLVLVVTSAAAGDTYSQNGAGCKITIESNP